MVENGVKNENKSCDISFDIILKMTPNMNIDKINRSVKDISAIAYNLWETGFSANEKENWYEAERIYRENNFTSEEWWLKMIAIENNTIFGSLPQEIIDHVVKFLKDTNFTTLQSIFAEYIYLDIEERFRFFNSRMDYDIQHF